jgi:prepilin-type N-terminal cleavage/methylation domain-containing protein
LKVLHGKNETGEIVKRRAFTLIELLVVIGIIGILVALILPAVQAARETARKVQCQSHLKQLAVAVQIHHDLHKHLPTNGWGHAWVGDPDRGFDRRQPGGWVYNVLPFLEQTSVREFGRGEPPAQKQISLGKLMQMPLAVLVCPSRRSAELSPYSTTVILYNAEVPHDAAKTDYAINGGDFYVSAGPGPLSASAQDIQAYAWPDTRLITGISFVGSLINLTEITDGSSNTYLVGEKYINIDDRLQGNGGDDQTMFLGDDADIRRWTTAIPERDTKRLPSHEIFGSRHSICLFSMCDGSVRGIAYEVDADVHRRLGNRHDGVPVQVP